MPELMTAILFEKNERALVVRRRIAPFAGQYLLPLIAVGEHEAAEEALRRHATAQFGLQPEVDSEAFVETVYLDDGAAQYVANIFRVPLPEGGMRFNAAGDYDDAKWLAAGELEGVPMPIDLRIPLAKVLTEPDALHELDWETMGRELNDREQRGEGVPLGEQATVPAASAVGGPAPDNRAGWDTIAKSYQEEAYGDRDAGRLKWSWGLFEDELQILGDVRGQRAIVLGCGGGQDVLALARMGAVAVGVDASAKQLEYARKHLVHHASEDGAANASFVEGDVADLSRFDDASFDLAVSIHALGYVEQAGLAVAEAARVLKPGGVLAIAVQHPMHHMRDSAPAYAIKWPYWTESIDWRWEFENGAAAEFRAYPRTIQQWFEMLTDAGFSVERLIEPQQSNVTGDDAKQLDMRLAGLQPYVLILKARKR